MTNLSHDVCRVDCDVLTLLTFTLRQLCSALWHAGYPYSYPTSPGSVILVCEAAAPSVAAIEDMSLLTCSVDSDAATLSQPITGDPRFQNAFLMSIFHSVLSLPGWRVGHTEEQAEGVLALPLPSAPPAVQRMLLVALVNISSSNTGRGPSPVLYPQDIALI